MNPIPRPTKTDPPTDSSSDPKGDPIATHAQTLRVYQTRVEQALARYLPEDASPPRLHAAMRYATLTGGKRIRACLVYASGTALGAELALLDAPACAVELIHSYSLVHDDLPSMDNDDMRRGRPSCHKAYDEATALLVGDALQTLAFQVLAEETRLAPEIRVHMIAQLARAAGSVGMAGGQAIDLAAVGQPLSLPALEDMHRRKTGALIRAAVRLGALAVLRTDDARLNQLEAYAQAVGLAFQIQDDVLDEAFDRATPNAGHAQAKPTYPSLLGLEGARAKAAELHAQALASVRALGDNGGFLAYIADYIISRTH